MTFKEQMVIAEDYDNGFSVKELIEVLQKIAYAGGSEFRVRSGRGDDTFRHVMIDDEINQIRLTELI